MKQTIYFSLIFSFLFYSCQSEKTGYVESDRLLIEYNKTSTAAKEIEKSTELLRNRFDTLQVELENLQKKFTKDLGSFSESERQYKEQEINRKQADVQRYYQNMSEEIRKQDAEVTRKLLKEISEVVKSYGEKHGYDYIYGATTSGNIVYAKPTKDLTDDIIKILNN